MMECVKKASKNSGNKDIISIFISRAPPFFRNIFYH